MGLPKLPTLAGLPSEQKLSVLKPYKKKPLNIHKMLLAKIKSIAPPRKGI